MKNLFTLSPLINFVRKTLISLLLIFSSALSFSQTSWIGSTDNDWANDANWTNNAPAAGVDAVIGDINFTGPFQPSITSLAVCQSLSIGSSFLITVNNSTLRIGGNITGSGQIDVGNGTLAFNGILDQVIPVNLITNKTIRNLSINNITTTTLQDSLYLTGTLNIRRGQLVTGGFLTLRSDATKTARIAPIQSVEPVPINGDVTVERYIPAHRGWRLLAVPEGTAQTIKEAWQEDGADGEDPNPGYGTKITGGSEINGFDQNASGNPSIKIYDQPNNSFSTNPLASTNDLIANQSGYLIFIRGDRSIDLNQGTNALPTSTTLRTRGGVTTGPKTFPVYPPASFTSNTPASQRPEDVTSFTLIGNPYASPINFDSFAKIDVPTRFYIWDPYLNSIGGYQTFDADNLYVPSPGGGSYGSTPNSIIQSGQAFFVESDPFIPGTIIIDENSKSSNDNNNGLRPSQNSILQRVEVNLNAVSGDVTTLRDGAVALFNKKFSDGISKEDAGKMNNIDENISFIRSNKILSIEKRSEISSNDTLFMKIWNLKKSVYQLDLKAENFNSSDLIAFLQDDYTHTSTPLDFTSSTQVSFSVTGDPASYSPIRFKITFKSISKIPSKPEVLVNNITVYPNPIKGRTITIHLNNQPQGLYSIILTDKSGRQVYKGSIQHPGGSANQSLHLNNYPAKGIYSISIGGANKTFTRQVIID